MKTKFNLILIIALTLAFGLSGCGDDDDRTNVQLAPYNGTDSVFNGLPYNGITVGIRPGAKLKPDNSSYTERSITFSMHIAPNQQTVNMQGMELVPTYWTFPQGVQCQGQTGAPGSVSSQAPLDFFAVSRGEYSRQNSGDVFGGDAQHWSLGPWERVRFALEGHGIVQCSGSRHLFQGELIVYAIDADVGFSFDTGTFGIRIGFGTARPPQRIGTIQ